MLNYIWLSLVVLAVLIGGWNGRLKEVTDASLEMAKFAVLDTALPLVGVMALWLGVMRLAERAGLIQALATVLRPIMRRLFPEVPTTHPAMGSMLMNLAANMLGLANAATPLGLRAMKQLESLNPRPGTATNAMCTFLAINTSSVQLIPATAIAILVANGSKNPTAIVGTALIATLFSTAAGITAVKLLEKLPMFRLSAGSGAGVPPVTRASRPSEGSATDEAVPGAGGTPTPQSTGGTPAPLPQPLPWWGTAALAAFALFFAVMFFRLTLPSWFGQTLDADAADRSVWIRGVNAVSLLAIPFLLAFFPLFAACKRIPVYEEFVEGAKEGFEVGVKIIPYLVAILVAIGMFRAAGGLGLVAQALGPVLNAIGFPPELLPLSLIRPLSGSGTLGIFTELVKQFGPDHLLTRTAGTIFGSTETTFYVIAVYFGSVAVRRTRHAVLAGLIADAVGIVASVIVCRIVFGGP